MVGLHGVGLLVTTYMVIICMNWIRNQPSRRKQKYWMCKQNLISQMKENILYTNSPHCVTRYIDDRTNSSTSDNTQNELKKFYTRIGRDMFQRAYWIKIKIKDWTIFYI